MPESSRRRPPGAVGPEALTPPEDPTPTRSAQIECGAYVVHLETGRAAEGDDGEEEAEEAAKADHANEVDDEGEGEEEGG